MIHDGIKERAAKRHSYSATQLVMRALCYTMGSAATTRSEGCIRLNYFKSNSLKDIPTSMVSCTCVACHLCDVANVFCWTSLALLGRTGDHSVCLSLSRSLSHWPMNSTQFLSWDCRTNNHAEGCVCWCHWTSVQTEVGSDSSKNKKYSKTPDQYSIITNHFTDLFFRNTDLYL